MSDRPVAVWLPRMLFWLTSSVAGLLLLAVLVAPWLDGEGPPEEGWSRLVVLFARDATVRRTSLAGGVGLFATACIFFRQPAPPAPVIQKPTRPPPTSGGIGA